MQARVMKLMLVMFTVLFLFFLRPRAVLVDEQRRPPPSNGGLRGKSKRRRAARPSWATPSRRSLPPQDMVASALSGYRDRTPQR